MSRRHIVDMKLTVTGPKVVPGALKARDLVNVADMLRALAAEKPELKNVAVVGIKAVKNGTVIEIAALPVEEAAP
jgi:hypothetical protein